MKRRFIPLVAVTVAAAMSFAVVASSASTTKKTVTPKSSAATTVTIGGAFADLFSGWDPYKNSWGNVTTTFFQAPYATLMNMANNGSTVEPGLAASWSYTNLLTFQIVLKPGLKFSNGEPVNAAAVKENIERAVDKSVVGPTTDELANVTSVVASGPLTVTLHLKSPDPALPDAFTQNMGMMVSPAGLKNESSLNNKPSGAGPYVLDNSATTVGSVWTFTRNKYYFDPKAYPYNKIIYKSIAAPVALFDALQSGQVDVARISSAQLSAAKAAGIRTLPWPSAINGLWISDRNGTIVPALKNVLVREAINYAINRPAVIAVNGGGTPTSSMFWPGEQAYSKAATDYYTYDPAKAKALLAEAGYPNGFSLSFLSDPFFDPMNDIVEADLQAVGIDATINDQTSSYITDLSTSPVSWFFWYPEDSFDDATQLLLPNGGDNYLHTDSPEVVKLFNEAASAKSTTAADDAWQTLNKYVVQQGWFAPIFIDGSQYFASNKTTKVVANAGNDWPFLRNIQPAS
jgi:peptide/nickel transport system substrate-binding protein